MTLLHNDRSSAVKLVGGGKLQRNRKRYSRTLRAVLADQLIDGPLAVNRLSPKQAAAITKTTMAEIRAVRRARTSSPADYFSMKIGRVNVDAVRKQQLANEPVSDERVKRIIERIGVTRVFDMLDTMTKPINGTAVSPNGHTANSGNGSATITPAQL